MQNVTARSYTLRTVEGDWLGQIVLTSDGMFSSVTDYGNLSYAWRAYGDKDFRQFVCTVTPDYFAGKMVNGMAYMFINKKFEAACKRFAEKILPTLQKALKEELEKELIVS